MRTKLSPEQIDKLDRKAHRLAADFKGHTLVDIPEVKHPEPIKEKIKKVKAEPRRKLLPGEKPEAI